MVFHPRWAARRRPWYLACSWCATRALPLWSFAGFLVSSAGMMPPDWRSAYAKFGRTLLRYRTQFAAQLQHLCSSPNCCSCEACSCVARLFGGLATHPCPQVDQRTQKKTRRACMTLACVKTAACTLSSQAVWFTGLLVVCFAAAVRGAVPSLPSFTRQTRGSSGSTMRGGTCSSTAGGLRVPPAPSCAGSHTDADGALEPMYSAQGTPMSGSVHGGASLPGGAGLQEVGTLSSCCMGTQGLAVSQASACRATAADEQHLITRHRTASTHLNQVIVACGFGRRQLSAHMYSMKDRGSHRQQAIQACTAVQAATAWGGQEVQKAISLLCLQPSAACAWPAACTDAQANFGKQQP